jgi:hypothetical protein
MEVDPWGSAIRCWSHVRSNTEIARNSRNAASISSVLGCTFLVDANTELPTRPRRRSSSKPTESASPIAASASRTACRSYSTTDAGAYQGPRRGKPKDAWTPLRGRMEVICGFAGAIKPTHLARSSCLTKVRVVQHYPKKWPIKPRKVSPRGRLVTNE